MSRANSALSYAPRYDRGVATLAHRALHLASYNLLGQSSAPRVMQTPCYGPAGTLKNLQLLVTIDELAPCTCGAASLAMHSDKDCPRCDLDARFAGPR